MPIYEYECPKCKNTFEVLKRITDDSLELCKICRVNMVKIISQSTFHLKGFGWARDGYDRDPDWKDAEVRNGEFVRKG